MRKRGSALESSSSTDHPAVRAGRLGRPHGLEGYLGLYVDQPDLVYFEPGSTVFVGERPLTVRQIRPADRGHRVLFSEITTREAAEEIRSQDVLVTERRELADREFWPEDLIGLEVRPGGGSVTGINFGPAQDRLVIERRGNTFEVPFVDELVPVVDVAAGYLQVVEIEGLTGQ